MTREWDAGGYDALPLPHEAWGSGVLDRLALSGAERVLDAGCGTGRDADALLDRWPGAGVVALDGSERMLERARERLGDRASYVLADLTDPAPFRRGLPGGPVDAVMSVAAFHWVPDHRTLFEHLAAVLAPGGRLVAECGGHGNIAGVRGAIERVTGRPGTPWEFARAEETVPHLERAGFTVEDVRLRPDPFRCDDVEVLDRYLATVVLGAHLDRLAEPDRAGFVAAVRDELPEPVIDYVRLEIEARRA